MRSVIYHGNQRWVLHRWSTQSVSDHNREPNRLAECVHAHRIRCIICMMEQSNLTLDRLESCVMGVAYSVIERSTSHAVKLDVGKRWSCCSYHLIKLAERNGRYSKWWNGNTLKSPLLEHRHVFFKCYIHDNLHIFLFYHLSNWNENYYISFIFIVIFIVIRKYNNNLSKNWIVSINNLIYDNILI